MFAQNNIHFCGRVFLVTVFFVLSCGPRQKQGSSLATVHGEVDNRLLVTSREAPYRYVGRWDRGCTGALVGPGLVLTALHCLLDEERENAWSEQLCYYRSNLLGATNSRLEVSEQSLARRFWYLKAKDNPGQPQVRSDRGQDWALVQLEKKLGQETGYFRISKRGFFKSPPEQLKFKKNVRFIGYSADRISLSDKDELLPLPNGQSRRLGYQASEDPSCLISNYAFQEGQASKRYLLHLCKETQGASGGPLFHRVGSGYEILAIQGADFPGDDYQADYIEPGAGVAKPNANVAIPVDHFGPSVSALLEIIEGNDELTSDQITEYVKSVTDGSHAPLWNLEVRDMGSQNHCEKTPTVKTYKQPSQVLPPPESIRTGEQKDEKTPLS